MSYTCYTEYAEPELLNISELFYEVKEKRLIEISLDNWLAIRQWKDVPFSWTADDWAVFDMDYWMLYCTHWKDIISVWRGWWETELKEYIKQCKDYI